eukprot:TRINITY_DN11529_c0_g1_i1.p1 TRINITY_DN11529_c0_g1~~TRINITY_DN11529_c0_g1_i1.p1  ORF type:complete len:568 (+),score=153.45 TRINITY_DN11529_c0_g1_i1:227-1705(+)
MFSKSLTGTSAYGSAMVACVNALEPTGGKILSFQSSLPEVGLGRLNDREASNLYGTDKEKTLYTSQESWYGKLAASLVKHQITVDQFLFPAKYIDIATLHTLSTKTCGQLYYYPGFRRESDGLKLHTELSRNIIRNSGNEGVMRIRTGPGLDVDKHIGHFTMANRTDINLPTLNSDTTFCVTLKHESKLTENTDTVLQCACLYRAKNGQARIRVHTLMVTATNSISHLFRNADLEAIMKLSMSVAATQIATTPLDNIRNSLISGCVDTLSVYRKLCASNSAPGQLILPEGLKLLPLYTSALVKNLLLRKGNDIKADMRCFQANLFASLPIAETVHLIHPRMYALHDMAPDVGTTSDSGVTLLPPIVNLSSEKIADNGAYLCVNGQVAFLFLAPNISSQFLQDVFGVASTAELDPLTLLIQERDNNLSKRICAVIKELGRSSGYYPHIRVVRRGDVSEFSFFNMLIEDKQHNQESYVDFLCTVHRQIQSKVSS